MADISKDELRKEITDILKNADLSTTSSKKVRQQLEEKLDRNLLPIKKEIDDLVMEYVNSKDKKRKKQDESEDDDDEQEDDVEEEEEEDDDDDESEEEAKPAKRAPAKKAPAKKQKKANSDDSEDDMSEEEYGAKKGKGKAKKAVPKKKKGSDSDSDGDWKKSAPKKAAKKPAGGGAKRPNSGYTRTITLSPELASLMGKESMARHEVVKKVWEIIKARNLYDPKNKQFAICDDDLFKVIGVKRFRTFGMMKFLKNHFVD